MALRPGQQPERSSTKRTVKDQSGAGKLKIGELLSKAGYITATQFEEAKAVQKKTGERLGRILLESGVIERDTIANFLSRMHNFTMVSIEQEAPSPEALALVPYETAKQFMAFPLRLAGNTLQLTMSEPTDSLEVEQLQDIVQRELTVCVSTAKDIIDAYRKYYGISDEEYHSFFTFESEKEETTVTQVEDFGALVSDAADEFEIESSASDEGAPTSSSPPRTRRSSSWSTAFWSRRCRMGSTTSSRSKRPCRSATASGSLFKSMNLPLTIKNAWPRA